ncbi:neuroendocrine protein 7B2 [Orussus abietinus]|uniref:neuroendocrine protein 7B2 n=1 Tax=Orussus abietinus TaxID=222816 RepID=UPI00062584F7|nr:neuroendocrine protein 7B2 [Orussus abietinus]XP_012271564.1 neuroendocrine protein 7B2 [Orussus abietinus]
MIHAITLLTTVVIAQASLYIPPMKEHYLSDALFRDLIDQMGNELVDAADTYLKYQDGPRIPGEYGKAEEIPMEMPLDYDGLDTHNPNPSIRDQEYLQHSSLWSHQRMENGGMGQDRHRIQPGGLTGIKDEKTENNLPAYCTPPNPCPIGYTSENNCIVNFENTAVFSRNYQRAQDCMCDAEHMLDCTKGPENNNALPNMRISHSDFDQIVKQFQEANPYFRGEKLPIAAKKGINVGY